MKEESVKKMKVSDLRAALTLRGLSTEGLKVDLVNRLQARLDEEEFGMVDAPVVPVAPMVEPESTSLVPPAAAPAVAVAAVPPLDNDPEPETTTGIAEKVHADVTPEVVGKGAITMVDNHATSKVTATITTTNEPSTISAKNATSTATGQTVVLPKITPDMSFEEKRRIRAARFNMTLVEESNKKNATGRTDAKTTTTNNNRSIDNKRGSKNVVAAEEGKVAKKAKVDTVVEKEEEELLPKEEIERRLKRLQKFTGEANQLAMDKLKAMLRKYRFMQKE